MITVLRRFLSGIWIRSLTQKAILLDTARIFWGFLFPVVLTAGPLPVPWCNPVPDNGGLLYIVFYTNNLVDPTDVVLSVVKVL